MAELIDATRGHYSHILIAGDFDFPIAYWNNISITKDTESIASKFLECMKGCVLQQHVCLPTHHSVY